jgi:hypothetical protein
VQLPVVHLNGTSREALTHQYTEAFLAVEAAMDVLRKLEVNARDYYPAGNDAAGNAQREHRERIQKLKDVAGELEAIALHCAES